MIKPANETELTAYIVEIQPMRYTPAGLPALNLRLDHESSWEQDGQVRKIKASIKAVAFGSVADKLNRLAIGSSGRFKGFLASPRQSQYVVLNIQEFLQE